MKVIGVSMLAKINVLAEHFLKDLNNTLDLFELALDPHPQILQQFFKQYSYRSVMFD